MFGRKRIYLDYASATPALPVAVAAQRRAETLFANPGALHAEAIHAKRSLEQAREHIAAQLACKSREVLFTSGLTESNALAIVGAARALERSRRTLAGTHWIVSAIEHSSVLECFAEVERMGGEVSHVDPDASGRIRPERLATMLKKETVFVSIGWANNEIGVVQPLSRIAQALRLHERAHGSSVLFHSDAGQAPVYLTPHVHTLGVDLFALGSGKLYGPRGIGALQVGTRAKLEPVLFGGGQERGLRPGTEEPALAIGFAEAMRTFARMRTEETKRVRALRDELARGLRVLRPEIMVNGDLQHALPNVLNISVPGEYSGEYLALRFDHYGVALSTKSACKEGEAASHVVEALARALPHDSPAREPWRSKNTLRFSLGASTTAGEIQRVVTLFGTILPKRGR